MASTTPKKKTPVKKPTSSKTSGSRTKATKRRTTRKAPATKPAAKRSKTQPKTWSHPVYGEIRLKSLGIGLAVVLVLGLVIGGVAFGSNLLEAVNALDYKHPAPPTSPVSESSPIPPDDSMCPDSWAIQESDNGENRWFVDGIAAIRKAESNDEAREAANTWLDRVKTDPQLLAGAMSYLLDQRVDPASLADGGCASTEAVTAVIAIEVALAEARVTTEDAPAEGRNSGVNGNGDVVASASIGISGDRSAVKVMLKNGKVIWIMARCGNPVIKGPPPVPEGPTDEKPGTKIICWNGEFIVVSQNDSRQSDGTCDREPEGPKCEPGVGENGKPPFCGTPGEGPEQQPPQEDISGQGGPTDGYEPGPDGDTPPLESEPAPSQSGSPGSSTTPGGGSSSGGSSGVSDPDDSPHYEDEDDWTGDGGAP